CKSVHNGNTMKVAEEMAEVLDCEVLKPEEVEDLEDYDMVGFGSGIYFTNFHEEIIDLVERLNGGKKAFIFSTSGFPNIPILHDFEGKLKEKLNARNFKMVGSFNCRGYDEYGPLRYLGGIHNGRPNEKDLKKARKFAEELKENGG
ncbi:MAG: flavodoxin family protein, partial [Candidatus Aenigmatarchaeota archaeon]